MIEKLVIQKLTIAGKKYEYPDIPALVDKINELVDTVNELQEEAENNARIRADHEHKIENLQKDYDNVCIWVGEQKLKTPADPYEEQRKALDVAVDALKTAHEYYQNCVIREKQPQEINWYCTAMNMDIDIFKALEQITALEQKEEK